MQIVNIILQMPQDQQELNNDLFQQLLSGIDFDEPMGIDENKVESSQGNDEFIELLDGVNFDEPMEESTHKPKAPILLPFSFCEEKGPMDDKISGTTRVCILTILI